MEGIRGKAKRGVAMATAEEAAGEEPTREFPRPVGLHSVQVRHAFARRYRVNVYVHAAAGSCRVAHSYFVEADEVGHLVRSSPEIARTY
jgi:hypothetical protein